MAKPATFRFHSFGLNSDREPIIRIVKTTDTTEVIVAAALTTDDAIRALRQISDLLLRTKEWHTNG